MELWDFFISWVGYSTLIYLILRGLGNASRMRDAQDEHNNG